MRSPIVNLSSYALGPGHAEPEVVMETVKSRDGTPIAFDRSGAGPALVLVLAPVLQEFFLG